jgi:tripartite ATP-independent transporter DctM subunit
MLSILFVAFLVLALSRMPIALALGLAAALALLIASDLPLAALPHKMVNAIDAYIFLAIPLFLLAGRLMNAGGITDRIFVFARALVGHISGGLAQANVLAGVIFSWMSGSAVAAVGGLGEIELKAMKDNGYDAPFASAVIVASSVLGPVIPPSIPLIIYAAMSDNSVGKLFLGAIIPGLLLALSLMILIHALSRRRGYPRDQRARWPQLWRASRQAFLPLLMPVIMLGGILAGIFTPTEAAAAAVVYALVLSMGVYREVAWRDLPAILTDTMVTTAVVTFIISLTGPFSFLLTFEDAGQRVGDLVLSFTSNKYTVLFFINILLLIFGALREAGVVLILFIPILYPLATGMGIDPIHFGVVMCVNLMIGVATPPIGVCLFVMSHISGLKVETLMQAVLPFLAPMLLVLFLVSYFPYLTTFLPEQWMK